MAAYKFASAKRVVSFGWDESTKYGDAIFTCNFQLEFTDGSIEDVCLRGLALHPAVGPDVGPQPGRTRALLTIC